MHIKRTLMQILLFAVLVGVCFATPAWSGMYIDFESGLGQDGQPLGSKFTGVTFTTASGYDVLFADTSTGAYNVTSDNGRHYGRGEYFIGGNAAAYTEQSDPTIIHFTLGHASIVRFGYSSASAISVNAFDDAGNLVDSVQGSSNVRSLGGTGLAFLQVVHPDIAYIQINDTGNFWMMDDLSSDAPVPEPSSVLAMGMGMMGLVIFRRHQNA